MRKTRPQPHIRAVKLMFLLTEQRAEIYWLKSFRSMHPYAALPSKTFSFCICPAGSVHARLQLSTNCSGETDAIASASKEQPPRNSQAQGPCSWTIWREALRASAEGDNRTSNPAKLSGTRDRWGFSDRFSVIEPLLWET